MFCRCHMTAVRRGGCTFFKNKLLEVDAGNEKSGRHFHMRMAVIHQTDYCLEEKRFTGCP